MNIEFKNKATVKNVNVRKEWHGDEGVIACDIKAEISLLNDELSFLDMDGDNFKEHFWDDEGNPRFVLVPTLQTVIKEDKHLASFGEISLSPATIKKLTVTPKSNHVAHVTFTISVELVAGVLDKLVGLVDSEPVDCVVQALNEELDLEPSDT